MAESRVASRYVKSLLGLAVEQGALEQVHQDMQLFDQVCGANMDFVLMLNSPIIKHNKKKTILEKIFKGKVHNLSIAIIDLLTAKNREPLLPAIAKEFHVAYNEFKGIGKASVITTIPVDGQLRSELEKIVKKLSNKENIEMDEKVDPDLIGGFILNVGDKQIDASIKSKLSILKVKFGENPYVREF
ncbi:MAG: ATP synthase F1 subunit delta [Bacteroidia bacterium]|nr:ATP synthase F1 subunit delta [Bacteroidia bacterium]